MHGARSLRSIDTVEPSEELKNVMLRLYESFEAGDSEALAHRFSKAEGLVVIGTDAGEWHVHHQELIDVLRTQFAELGGWRWVAGDLETWHEGSVGWTVDRLTIHLSDREVHTRVTTVFHLEHGEWKVVQWHFSVGIPNEEALGVQLTTSMDALAEAAAADQPDLEEATSPEGTVTILFTDIENSSVLTERLGDLRWMKLLGEHNERVRQQVEATGGFVVKTQGDGFMLAFASARRALHCAAGIQRSMVDLRADGEGRSEERRV